MEKLPIWVFLTFHSGFVKNVPPDLKSLHLSLTFIHNANAVLNEHPEQRLLDALTLFQSEALRFLPLFHIIHDVP